MTIINQINPTGSPVFKGIVALAKAGSVNTVFNNSEIDQNKTERINEAKQELMNKIYSELNLDPADENFKVEIINVDGKYYLKLTRLKCEGTNYKLGDIKNKLSIANDVISNNNDLRDVTGRPNLNKSDSASIEPNKSIKIPLEEIGTTVHYHVDSWFPGNLHKAVQKFLDTVK